MIFWLVGIVIEIEQVLRVLDGWFILVGLLGLLLCGLVNVLFIGCNFYFVDFKVVLFWLVWEVGVVLVDLLLVCYCDEYGWWLWLVGLLVWGILVMCMVGDDIVEVFVLLGVWLVWDDVLWWVIDLVFMQLVELGCLCIDVMVWIFGFFCDVFLYVVIMFDDVVWLVVDFDEVVEDNYVCVYV